MSELLLDITTDPDPQRGFVCGIYELPACDFCGEPAHFDFYTIMGFWAYGCSDHYLDYRQALELGMSKGQRLVVRT